MTVLRQYQREAVQAVLEARRAGVRRQLVSLPTGAGKTVIFSELARLARRQVLVLAHREELIHQARAKLEQALAGTRVVALERGSERAPAEARVVVCSIRSLHEERLARVVRGRELGLVVYDECHHAAADDNLRVLRQLGAFDADWQGTLLGFTATTERGDGKGLDAVFERIVYSRTLPQLIDDGYLCPLRGYRINTSADLGRIVGSGSDFPEGELAEAVDIEERNALVARSLQELARDRRTIVFCVTVNHARNVARALNWSGVRAGIVHGELAPDVRAATLADFRAGKLEAITNVGVLTEGFDDPGVSCVAMARPTRSAGLYAQCVGRGTRLHPGKRDCLILDFVDASALGLCSLPSLFGAPRDLDLRGGDVSQAKRAWDQLLIDRPGFEVEAGSFTLSQIQELAARFDPLGLRVDDELPALSANAWFSLGRHGVGLHFVSRSGQRSEALVLRRKARGKAWEVQLDGQHRADFSRLEDAVMAVDYEVEQLGRGAVSSARSDAPWRKGAVPPALSALLGTGSAPSNVADALRLLAWQRLQR